MEGEYLLENGLGIATDFGWAYRGDLLVDSLLFSTLSLRIELYSGDSVPSVVAKSLSLEADALKIGMAKYLWIHILK